MSNSTTLSFPDLPSTSTSTSTSTCTLPDNSCRPLQYDLRDLSDTISLYQNTAQYFTLDCEGGVATFVYVEYPAGTVLSYVSTEAANAAALLGAETIRDLYCSGGGSDDLYFLVDQSMYLIVDEDGNPILATP